MFRASLLQPLVGFCLCWAALGCGSQAATVFCNPTALDTAPPLATAFDPLATGTIEGHVTWFGPVPDPAAFAAAGLGTPLNVVGIEQLNPGLPRVEPVRHGVDSAVVYLRRVDPARSKQWDQAPARVTIDHLSLRIHQGETESHCGFVHLGESVEISSTSPNLEMLRAQGAAFFTLPFPAAGAPRSREFHQCGIVELSNALGRYWARSWLFVTEHPYYCLTDRSGHFRLTDVPEGAYELVCWMPNWNVDHFDRDPELQNVSRVWFKPPMQRSMTVLVRRGEVVKAEFNPSIADFK